MRLRRWGVGEGAWTPWGPTWAHKRGGRFEFAAGAAEPVLSEAEGLRANGKCIAQQLFHLMGERAGPVEN